MKNNDMKNISYLISLMCLGIFWLSCKDDVRIPAYQTGANLRIVIDPAHSFIHSTAVATEFIAWEAFSENKDLDHVDIFLKYKGQEHLIKTYSQEDFSTGSVSGTFNASDLAGWFGVPGFADGTRGGNFSIHPVVKLDDGRIYPSYVHTTAGDSILNIGTGPLGNIGTGAFTTQRGTGILCPPVDISGNYKVVSATGKSTDGCCPDEVTVSGDIVVIDALQGSVTNFSVSDITGGLYFAWYAVYGITGPDDSPGEFLFNCNEVSIVNTKEPFGTSVLGEGLYDETTGTITYTWSNGYADRGTVVLQKQ
ncbi:MAG: hypothetical protein WAT91_08780 [Saprospiraceae bacterium]